jgi:hypothetical protein
LLNFCYQLFNLLVFAGTHVEEADADGVAVVDGLDGASETEGEALDTEFDFDAGVDADREALVAADAAAAKAEVDDAAWEAGADFDEDDGGRGVDRVSKVMAAFRWRRIPDG